MSQNFDFICEVEPKDCDEGFTNLYDLNKHIIQKHSRSNYGIHLRLKRIEECLTEQHKLMVSYDE